MTDDTENTSTPTVAEIVDAIAVLGQVLDEQEASPGGRYVVVHPSWLPTIARALGVPVGRHRRARGVRGRKRALYASWRPIWKHGCKVETSHD
jgi:hypothetical protein